jgi:hypothetical protein
VGGEEHVVHAAEHAEVRSEEAFQGVEVVTLVVTKVNFCQ